MLLNAFAKLRFPPRTAMITTWLISAFGCDFLSFPCHVFCVWKWKRDENSSLLPVIALSFRLGAASKERNEQLSTRCRRRAEHYLWLMQLPIKCQNINFGSQFFLPLLVPFFSLVMFYGQIIITEFTTRRDGKLESTEWSLPSMSNKNEWFYWWRRPSSA